MAQPRAKTSRPSSPAGEGEYAEAVTDDDLCGFGCHSAGVPEGAVSVGCEHGTFVVTESTKRKAAAVAQRVETVHDRSVHFESERELAADSGAVAELLKMVNRHEETILKLSSSVRQLQAAVGALTAGPAAEGDATGDATE